MVLLVCLPVEDPLRGLKEISIPIFIRKTNRELKLTFFEVKYML